MTQSLTRCLTFTIGDARRMGVDRHRIFNTKVTTVITTYLITVQASSN